MKSARLTLLLMGALFIVASVAALKNLGSLQRPIHLKPHDYFPAILFGIAFLIGISGFHLATKSQRILVIVGSLSSLGASVIFLQFLHP